MTPTAPLYDACRLEGGGTVLDDGDVEKDCDPTSGIGGGGPEGGPFSGIESGGLGGDATNFCGEPG